MIRTAVGYAGGTTPNPDYRHIGDHSETVRVEYDPGRISFGELLKVFWDSHDPVSSPYGRQYRNAVFTLNDDQQRLALEFRQQVERRTGREVRTAVEAGKDFHSAEEYHQKYLLRGSGELFRELRSTYSSDNAFVASTAAARVNGYLGCNGGADQLQREIGHLGLSPEAQARLIDRLKRTCDGFQGVSCPVPRD